MMMVLTRTFALPTAPGTLPSSSRSAVQSSSVKEEEEPAVPPVNNKCSLNQPTHSFFRIVLFLFV